MVLLPQTGRGNVTSGDRLVLQNAYDYATVLRLPFGGLLLLT